MNVYERALAVLDERGWTQGYFEDASGAVCLAGALIAATNSNGKPDMWNRAAMDAASHLASVYLRRDDLSEFNDDPHTTEEDVRLLLKRAAAGER